jgi:hypothetical protein
MVVSTAKIERLGTISLVAKHTRRLDDVSPKRRGPRPEANSFSGCSRFDRGKRAAMAISTLTCKLFGTSTLTRIPVP